MFFTDQLNRQIEIKAIPQRVISLVPSQSEFLWDLGIQSQLIGITKFCIHPNQMFETVERIGGTKNLKLERIVELKPDLIIANKEENTLEEINYLSERFPVYISDVNTLEEAYNMMETIGAIFHKQELVSKMVKDSKDAFNLIPKLNKRVMYMMWNNPYMAVALNTFIDDMLKQCGFVNVCRDLQRYPEISVDMLKKFNPDFVLLSSEPFPFKNEHAIEINNILPETKVVLVDGEMFSWYGSRLVKAPLYFKQLVENM